MKYLLLFLVSVTSSLSYADEIPEILARKYHFTVEATPKSLKEEGYTHQLSRLTWRDPADGYIYYTCILSNPVAEYLKTVKGNEVEYVTNTKLHRIVKIGELDFAKIARKDKEKIWAGRE